MPNDLVRFCFGHANQSVTDGYCKLRNEMAFLRKVRTKKESACSFLTQKIRLVCVQYEGIRTNHAGNTRALISHAFEAHHVPGFLVAHRAYWS